MTNSKPCEGLSTLLRCTADLYPDSDCARDWVHSAKSRPVDLDQVTARLLNASASPVSPRPSSWSPTPGNVPTPKDEESYHQELMREESEAYDYLVADGGRPWYPIHLLDHVSRHPENYRDMLRFWCSGDDWLVYTMQWERWQKFRKWQRDNRGSLDVQAEFEREKVELTVASLKYSGKDLSKDTEEQWAQLFERVRNRRGWEHRYTVEGDVISKRGEARFPAYVKAMRARLERHGLSRPVRLDRDHQKQDPLTTWIEYLNYEYWVHDRFADKAAKLQPRYETTLRDLMDADVLLPGETPDSVCDLHHGFIIQREKRVADEAVDAAEAAVAVAKKDLDTRDHAARRPRQEAELARVRANLKKAVEAADAVKKRSELIFAFGSVYNPFSQSRREAEKHEILLEWILDQVPLIEAEMAEAKEDAVSGRKRTRADSDELESEEPAARRHKPDAQTAQDVQPEPNLLPEPPAQTSTRPSQKRAREDDDEGEPEIPGTKRQKPDAQATQEAQPVFESRTARSKQAQQGQNQAAPDSEPPPRQAQNPSNKATTQRRQPRSKANTSKQPVDRPPPRRSARIAALQERASTVVEGATARQDTTTSSSTPSSKPTPAVAKRKRIGEEEPPRRCQRKRRR